MKPKKQGIEELTLDLADFAKRFFTQIIPPPAEPRVNIGAIEVEELVRVNPAQLAAVIEIHKLAESCVMVADTAGLKTLVMFSQMLEHRARHELEELLAGAQKGGGDGNDDN